MDFLDHIVKPKDTRRAMWIDEMITSLQHPKKRLSTWELNFLESVNDQFARTSDISDKQYELLRRISAEKGS